MILLTMERHSNGKNWLAARVYKKRFIPSQNFENDGQEHTKKGDDEDRQFEYESLSFLVTENK